MILRADNLWTEVEDLDKAQERFLWDHLAIKDPQAFHTQAYKLGHWDGMVRLYDRRRSRFASGLVRVVVEEARRRGVPVEVNDRRRRPEHRVDLGRAGWLRDYQTEAVEAAFKRTRGIVQGATGMGKCLGRGTLVLMADGSRRPAEQVQVGDLLMGPDSRPRRVLSTTQGRGPLRLVEPVKGKPWVCNDVHVLTLVHTETGEIVDVPMDEYEGWTPYQRHCHKQFSVGVEFPAWNESPPVDPYFLGIWLGDGRRDLRQGISISKPDPEIEEACRQEATRWGLELRVDEDPAGRRCKAYRIVKAKKGPLANPLTTALRGLSGRGIPHRYLTGSRQERLALLAGLLDTDGYHDGRGCFQFSQKAVWIADHVAFLARSLGLRAVVTKKHVLEYGDYWIVSISGHTDEIPTRLPRKQAPARRQKKHPTRTGIKVTPMPEGDYFGFTLDGDGRFLLGDFTVTHNTECFTAMGAAAGDLRWLVLVDTRDLMHQAAERFEKRTGEEAGRCGDGVWRRRRYNVATVQTLTTRFEDEAVRSLLDEVDGVIVDEVQIAASDGCQKVLMSTPNAFYRFGFSATPNERRDRRDLLAVAALGPICHHVPEALLVEAGAIADARVRFVKYRHDRYLDWPAARDGLIADPGRNALCADMVAAATRPTIAHTRFKHHGYAVRDLLQGRGLRVELVDGDADTGSRKSAIKRLERRDIDVLVASRIFKKGVDVPEARSVVNFAGGDSSEDAIQLLGRAGRAIEGVKETCEYWDVRDQGDPILSRHAKHRMDALAGRGWRVDVLDAIGGAPNGIDPAGQ